MRLQKQVYIYFGSYVINAALSFAILSTLTHYLSTYDYGVINLYSSFLIFLMPFVTGGVLYPLTVEYFKRPQDAYKNYFSNAQVIPLISVLLCTLLCFLFAEPLERLLKVPLLWILLLPITAWWIMVNETVTMISRNRNKPFQFASFYIGKGLLEAALTVLFVIALHKAWEGRLLSGLLAPLLLGILAIYFFYRWRLIADKINWSEIRKIFILCLPFVIERLSVFVMSSSDKYFIDAYVLNGTNEVGLYGLGSQLATIVFVVVISMNSAYQPYLFKKLADGFVGIHKTTLWFVGACAAVVLGMFIAIPLFFRFFIGEDFQAAKPYAFLLCTGFFIWGIFNAFQVYLIYLQKGRVILLISLLGMIASLTLNFILVPRYGAMGSAYANIITYALMALAGYLFVHHFFVKKKAISTHPENKQ